MKKLLLIGLVLGGLSACQSPAPPPPAATPLPAEQAASAPAYNGPLVTAVRANGTIELSDGSKQTIPHYDDPHYFVLYLVRHCEKATGNDPDLSPEGQARAQRLGQIMDDARLDKVVVTNTKRTIQTANAVRLTTGDPAHDNILPEMSLGWLQDALPGGGGRRDFYVGHSNTVPQLLNALTNSKRFADIPDNEFGRFYVAVTKGTGQTEVLELHY